MLCKNKCYENRDDLNGMDNDNVEMDNLNGMDNDNVEMDNLNGMDNDNVEMDNDNLDKLSEEDMSIKSYMITYYVNESDDVYDIVVNDKKLWIMMRVINMIYYVKMMNKVNNCNIKTSKDYYEQFDELLKDNLIYFYKEEREYIHNMLNDGFIRNIFTILDYL